MMIKTTLINLVHELEYCAAHDWTRYPDNETMNTILEYLKNEYQEMTKQYEDDVPF